MQMEGLVEKRRCQTNASPRPMSCWVHAAARDDRCRRQIEEAISSEAKEDECKVALSGEERDFWMGTEASIEAALRQADETEDILYLCDNQSGLTEVNGWIGEGGKATLATAPNADIMREVLCTLRMRIAVGSATFLIKVKSHRGEPIIAMSRQMIWPTKVGKKRMTRVRGQHELGGWCSRKRTSTEKRSL